MKKLATLLLAIAMVFSLVGCGQKDEPAPVEPTQETADVPTEDGKVTIYFEMDEAFVPSDHTAVYYASPANSWGSTLFTNKEGTNIYYTMLDMPADVSTWQNGDAKLYDYQIALGYNAASGVPANKQAIDWTYKFVQETTGTDNPHFDWDGTSNVVFLGSGVTFDKDVPAAAPVENVTLTVTFAEAIPENYVVYFAGSWNGWDFTLANMAAEPDADRKVFTKTFAGDSAFFEGTYEWQIVAADKDLAEFGDWSAVYKVNECLEGNASMEITALDANQTVDIFNGQATAIDWAQH